MSDEKIYCGNCDELMDEDCSCEECDFCGELIDDCLCELCDGCGENLDNSECSCD